jgi:hypothetical protein
VKLLPCLLATLFVAACGAEPASNIQPLVHQGNCSSEYEGACVPNGRDYDCSEIDGKDFASVGSDPDRLDRDRDGIACESYP